MKSIKYQFNFILGFLSIITLIEPELFYTIKQLFITFPPLLTTKY